MSLNVVPAPSVSRQPRGAVKINGQAVEGWLDISWEENEYTSPDTFRVRFALSAMPADRRAAFWAGEADIEVELFAGFPLDPEAFTAADLDSVFLGKVDTIGIDWDAGLLSLDGRDLSAVLIDHKTSEKYRNNTSSEIATKVAAKYGLTPKVKATTVKAGRYYEIDHVDLQAERTEWDLLTWLAQEEGFAVFMRGRELHFEPRPESGESWLVKWEPPPAEGGSPVCNVEGLRTSHTLTVAKGIEVTVKSYNSKTKKTTTKVSKRAGKGKGDVQKYSRSFPNLTPDEVQRKADQLRDDISRHEVKMSFDGAADNLLHIDTKIRLSGTGTAFDQEYFPESIGRTLSFDGGYEWDVEAKNHAPESEPTL